MAQERVVILNVTRLELAKNKRQLSLSLGGIEYLFGTVSEEDVKFISNKQGNIKLMRWEHVPY